MALRPTSAHWFEVVVPENDLGDAMEALASRGQVQFEWTGERSAPDRLQTLAGPVARYRELAAAHGTYWPAAVFEKRCCTLPLEVSVQAALHQMERWREAAAPLLERVAALKAQRHVLRWWRELLPVLDARAPGLDLAALAGAGPVLTGVCLRLPDRAAGSIAGSSFQPAAETAGLVLPVAVNGWQARLGLVPAAERDQLCVTLAAAGGECLPVPDGLKGVTATASADLSSRLADVEQELAAAERQLRELAHARGLDRAAGVLERIDWFRETADNMPCEGGACWITGWTSEADATMLDRALAEVGVTGQVTFVEPPVDATRPSVLRHPHWLAPFEVFTRAVGVPGITEADPTTWVALLVPLLFGYMCGDLGHGAVIAATGLLLRRRTRLWPLLVVCGCAAMGFGILYGEVFAIGSLIRPLWLHPLDHPLTLLAVPILFGALVLTLGLVLRTVQSCWRGEGWSEGVADVAQTLVYWGALLAFVHSGALWLILGGALLCTGNRLLVQRDPMAVAAGLGHLMEATFSLLLNTLSFARVGAFALAHAALETVVLAIADSVSGAAASVLIMVLGNLFVIVLESVVVSIQTSRLVLFEFFVRFFEGGGRAFEPAQPPPHGIG
jgi:V/A-type H+-transporting ATPase subunit I